MPCFRYRLILYCLFLLPLSYSKDMQEDKEPLFDTTKTLSISIAAMSGMIADMIFRTRFKRGEVISLGCSFLREHIFTCWYYRLASTNLWNWKYQCGPVF